MSDTATAQTLPMTAESALSDQLALVHAQLIPVDEIYLDHEWNSRGEFSIASIVDLADSIRATGLRDAILVRHTTAHPGYKYVTVYGHRRLAAHQYLRRPLIPAKVTTLSESTALILNIKENLERVDVNFWQQATSIGRLVKMGFTMNTLKTSLKRSTKWITQRMKLLELPEQAHTLAALGVLKPSHVEQFSRIPSLSGQMVFLRKLKDGHRQIETGEHIAKAIRAIEDKPKQRPHEVRSLTSLAEMQRRVQSVFGLQCPEAMTIAWVGGWISDDEYYDYVQARATEQGKFFRRPEVLPMSAIG